MVMLDARTLSGFVRRMTHRLLSWVLRLTVPGNPDFGPDRKTFAS